MSDSDDEDGQGGKDSSHPAAANAGGSSLPEKKSREGGASDFSKQIPMHCSLSGALMSDPVVTPQGVYFERQAILG